MAENVIYPLLWVIKQSASTLNVCFLTYFHVIARATWENAIPTCLFLQKAYRNAILFITS